MNQNFFEWLPYFENVNIKTYDIAKHNSFESFKNAQIEQSLKKCYVKDLLAILQKKYSRLFIINGVDVYSTLQEMIGRRNVHLHHNGIADFMYLNNFNIYAASEGDYLEITKSYFEKTVDTTKQFISSIVSNCL